MKEGGHSMQSMDRSSRRRRRGVMRMQIIMENRQLSRIKVKREIIKRRERIIVRKLIKTGWSRDRIKRRGIKGC